MAYAGGTKSISIGSKKNESRRVHFDKETTEPCQKSFWKNQITETVDSLGCLIDRGKVLNATEEKLNYLQHEVFSSGNHLAKINFKRMEWFWANETSIALVKHRIQMEYTLSC